MLASGSPKRLSGPQPRATIVRSGSWVGFENTATEGAPSTDMALPSSAVVAIKSIAACPTAQPGVHRPPVFSPKVLSATLCPCSRAPLYSCCASSALHRRPSPHPRRTPPRRDDTTAGVRRSPAGEIEALGPKWRDRPASGPPPTLCSL